MRARGLGTAPATARWLLTVVVLGCVSGVGRRAQADDTHYQDYVIGGRAVGLGGAFAALADDASGLYYNPAGIADAIRDNIQLDTSLYGFERGAIDRAPLPVPGVANFNLDFADLIVVPASSGFVKRLGPIGWDGQPTQAFGVSVVVPAYRSFVVSSSTNGADDSLGTYQRRVTDRELLAGAGYAWKMGSSLRLGVSAYYTLRSLFDREDVTVLRDAQAPAPHGFETATNEINALSGGVFIVGGIKYHLDRSWSLGASVQLPSLQVHGHADLRFGQSSADPASAQSDLQNHSFASAAQIRQAPRIRLGAAYHRGRRRTFSLDVSAHAPTRYRLVDADASYVARLPFNPEVTRQAVVNANLGGEVLLIPEVSVAAGAFTDFSTAPAIAAVPTADQAPHVHLFGLTLALGYVGEYTLTRLGVVYSVGQGHDVIPSAGTQVSGASTALRQFSRVRYFQSFFYVFISSSFRYADV